MAKQSNTVEFTTRIDTVSASLSYIGHAYPGADEGDPVWRIKKVQTVGTVDSITYANGLELFNEKWDDRAVLNYL